MFKSTIRTTITALLLIAVAVPAAAQADTGEAQSHIVVYRDSVEQPDRETDRLERDLGFSSKHRYRYAVKGFAALLDAEQAAIIAEQASVEWVQEDSRVTKSAPAKLASNELVPKSLRRIGLATTRTTRRASTVNVAVVDTGIDLDHPDLNVVAGKNCISRRPPDDFDGHGSHVAGTIAARNQGLGVVGAAPGTRLYAVKVLGPYGGSYSEIACGLDWIARTRVDGNPRNNIAVANMSLGGNGYDDGACGTKSRDVMHRAVCRLTARGVLVVAAAGNETDDLANHVPAAYDKVLTVTGMSDTDARPGATGGFSRCHRSGSELDDDVASFSNWATTPADAAHVIAAPGVCVESTWKNGGLRSQMSGTSMAAPAVTGVVALCLGERGGSQRCKGMRPAATMRLLRTDAARHARSNPGAGFAGDIAHPKPSRTYGNLVTAP